MVLFNLWLWDKVGVHTFPLRISPNVNVTAWRGIELAYFKAAVQLFSY